MGPLCGSLKHPQVILSHCVWLAPEGFGDLAFVGIYRGPYFAVLELQAEE